MMDKSIVIFPFSSNTMPIVRFRHLLPWRTYRLVSPIGWRFCGKDASCVDRGMLIGITVEADFQLALQASDAVFFDWVEGLEELTREHCRQAKAMGKRIIVTEDMLDNTDDILKNYDQLTTLSKQYLVENEGKRRIRRIPFPVVMIFGQGPFTQKFDLQVSLRERFTCDGYQVLQFGTKAYSELFDMFPLPDTTQLPLDDAIYATNDYIYSKVQKNDMMCAL